MDLFLKMDAVHAHNIRQHGYENMKNSLESQHEYV